MYVCMYACMYVCMYGWMDGWMDGCMYVCMDVCMYAWYVCMYVCNDGTLDTQKLDFNYISCYCFHQFQYFLSSLWVKNSEKHWNEWER